MTGTTQWPGGSTYSEWKKYWDPEAGQWQGGALTVEDIAEQDIVSAINEIERLRDLFEQIQRHAEDLHATVASAMEVKR